MDAVVLAVHLEGLAAKLWPSVRTDGLGEAKVLKPLLLDGLGDSKRSGGGQAVHPWIAGVLIYHHQVVVAAHREQVHAHSLHGLGRGGW